MPVNDSFEPVIEFNLCDSAEPSYPVPVQVISEIVPWMVMGVYAFNLWLFEMHLKLIHSQRNEMEITDAISPLIDSGFKVVPHQVEGWWKDTGKPEDILEANHLILDLIEPSNEGKVEDGATIAGRVKIDKGTVIFGKSAVRGLSIIGENAKIGPNAYIGPIFYSSPSQMTSR